MAHTPKSHRKVAKQAAKKQKTQKRRDQAKRLVRREQAEIRKADAMRAKTAQMPRPESRIERVPNEMLLQVVKHLQPASRVSFALTCKKAYATVISGITNTGEPRRLENILSVNRRPSCSCSPLAVTCDGCQVAELHEHISSWMGRNRVKISSCSGVKWRPIDKLCEYGHIYDLLRNGCKQAFEGKITDLNRQICALPTNRAIFDQANVSKTDETRKIAKDAIQDDAVLAKLPWWKKKARQTFPNSEEVLINQIIKTKLTVDKNNQVDRLERTKGLYEYTIRLIQEAEDLMARRSMEERAYGRHPLGNPRFEIPRRIQQYHGCRLYRHELSSTQKMVQSLLGG